MLPDRVLNPGPVTYESGALPIALRGPAQLRETFKCIETMLHIRRGNGDNLGIINHISP